ncbi:MAG: DUF72 domain-containing protein [Calditrichia bacterium]
MEYIIGTSGYSYEDWRGVFYPPDLPKGKMLDYYCQHFKAVEVNSTYYRIPHPAVFYQMEQKTPDDFQFVVKAHQETTHLRQKNREAVQQLIEAVQPLIEKGKLSGFLAQFPYSFKNTPANRDYLVQTRSFFQNYPLFVEFRNWTWDNPPTMKFLQDNRLAFVNVDQPRLPGLMKPRSVVTADLGYLRFHGRNKENWWKGTNQTRYDYLYSQSELNEWLIRIAEMLKKTYRTYIFFNNHPRGHAVQNAKELKEMLDNQIDRLFNLSESS